MDVDKVDLTAYTMIWLTCVYLNIGCCTKEETIIQQVDMNYTNL
jgi:hypothetical protein